MANSGRTASPFDLRHILLQRATRNAGNSGNGGKYGNLISLSRAS